MNKREEQRLNELLAKKEAEEKADKQFFKQVKKRKEEVLKVLKVEGAAAPAPNYYEERIKQIASKYGCTEMELLDYIETERQINYYRKYNRSYE